MPEKIFKKKVSFLILDFERPKVLKTLLDSLRSKIKLNKDDYEIICLANGGSTEYQDEVYGFYKNGLIDDLILKNDNLGGSVGTISLFKYTNSDYAFYLQSDHILVQDITEETINYFIGLLNSGYNNVDLAGAQTRDKNGDPVFSERASFMNVKFYNDIENKSLGSPGPFHHVVPWLEGQMQELFKSENWNIAHISPVFFQDNGKLAVRTNPDGSIWRHETDTKRQWLIKGPVKEKYVYPNFNQEEWLNVLKSQEWEGGKIPENEKPHSFLYWKE